MLARFYRRRRAPGWNVVESPANGSTGGSTGIPRLNPRGDFTELASGPAPTPQTLKRVHRRLEELG